MAVTVVVPGLPLPWAAAEAWEVSWESSGGSGGPVRAAPGQTLVLALPRCDEAAVFCRAVFGAGRSLPYGAAWPQDLAGDGTLRPSAAGGYAASLAAAFYRAGYRACGFNLQRFATEAEGRLADPWDLAPESLAVVAAERRFRLDHLKVPETVAVAVTGLTAALAPDSPWGRAVVPDSAGNASVELPVGRVRRWLGGGTVLTVSVSPVYGSAWTLAGPDRASSGILMTNELPEPSLLVTDASPP